MKIIITESQLKKLNEDITASRMIVYHRTGKKTGFNPSKNIADIGYNIGKGDAYGYGVYTTYDIESQLNDGMRNTYGNIIIESKILDMSKFLIFNYDIAKKIYKSRYQFRDQLEQILGKKEWLNYKNNDTIKDIHYTLDEGNVDYTSKLAQDFYISFRDSILRKLNGIIFTGGNDGNVLVVYNRRNIEPLRYSEDDGQTWTNVRNVKTYQRIKDSDDYKNNIELHHILNNIENEGLDGDFIIKIPEKYQDYILNHLSKKGDKLNYDEKDFIYIVGLYRKFGDINIFKILNNSKDKEQTALELIEMKGDDLTPIDIVHVLNYFTIPDNKGLVNIDVLIKKIIEVKGEKLEIDDIKYLFRYSVNKDDIVTKIIEIIGEKINSEKINSENLYLLQFLDNKDDIATKFIETKGKELNSYDIEELLTILNNNKYDITPFILKIIQIKGENLNYDDIVKLLYHSVNKDEIATKIIETKGKRLYSHDIESLLLYSDNKNDIATKILDVKGEKINSENLYLLQFLDNKDDIATKFIESKGKELKRNDLGNLFKYLQNKELVKKLLLQNGVYHKLINNVISYYKIDTPLIPDNYQSMLNEIRRIKEIMI